MAGWEETEGMGDEERAVAMFRAGRVPSEIDALMGMPDGWARGAVVRHWARDKADYSQRRG